MKDKEIIEENVIKALKKVIDPETGADVYRMRLVDNLQIHDDGTAEYIFRPSSPLCPIALTLVLNIIEVIKEIDGINDQKIKVVDYIGAEELNRLLAELPLAKSQK
jgi:metal-sulfur cluster biosynthetic enzyme